METNSYLVQLKFNLLASVIGGEVAKGSYWGNVVWDFINGVYHKMLSGQASTEPANGQGQLVQSANYRNHPLNWRAQLVQAIERPLWLKLKPETHTTSIVVRVSKYSVLGRPFWPQISISLLLNETEDNYLNAKEP